MGISATNIATTALGLSVALAWNDAVKAVVNDNLRPGARSTGRAMVIYAVAVTLLILITTVVVMQFTRAVSRLSNFMTAKARGVGTATAGCHNNRGVGTMTAGSTQPQGGLVR